jgi:hypothetical protein
MTRWYFELILLVSIIHHLRTVFQHTNGHVMFCTDGISRFSIGLSIYEANQIDESPNLNNIMHGANKMDTLTTASPGKSSSST